jgi:serine/threonine protein kinase
MRCMVKICDIGLGKCYFLLMSAYLCSWDFTAFWVKDTASASSHKCAVDSRAPEFALGVTIDCKIEIWSLGCLTREFVCGGRSFDAADTEIDLLILWMSDALPQSLQPIQ